jgi:hypothetical protein
MNVSSVDAQDLLVHEYLTAVARAAADLPAVHRDELLTDLREHIAVARSQHEPTEAGVRTILDRLGHPLAIVDAARGLVTGAAEAWAWAPGMWAGMPGAWTWAPGAPIAVGTAPAAAAPASAPDGWFAAIWQRSPIAVAIVAVVALGLLVLIVGVAFTAVAVTPPVPG